MTTQRMHIYDLQALTDIWTGDADTAQPKQANRLIPASTRCQYKVPGDFGRRAAARLLTHVYKVAHYKVPVPPGLSHLKLDHFDRLAVC